MKLLSFSAWHLRICCITTTAECCRGIIVETRLI